ncbi:MAG: hypothetical protein QNI96_04650 [Woeseiaceae bacterium]|nr:hypothetical protein [Woeseiaceae bacterium]
MTRLAARVTLLGALIYAAPGTVFAQEENALDENGEIPEKSIQIDVGPETEFNLGGAVWLRGALSYWVQEEDANRKGFYADQVRLSMSGTHGKDGSDPGDGYLKFSAQIRFWQYQRVIHHMWLGYQFNDRHDLQVGVTQAPFGILPATSNSFWYSMGYYHGIEDDRDAGIKYRYQNEGLDVHLAWFFNDEYNDSTALNRFAPDLVTDGDQQNDEENQANVRVAYTFGEGTQNSSEIGASLQYGEMPNRTTGRTGDRWQAAVHYVGNYDGWNPKLQVARYEYDPENPAGVDDRLVLMGFFSDQRLVAAEATAVSASLRRLWDVNWGPFTDFNAYLDYSAIYKEEDEFADTELINPGMMGQAGPVFVWLDFLWAKNGWWFNDSQANSGPGLGSVNPDKWEFRANLSLQWYF